MFFKKYLRKALQIQFFLLTLPPSGRLHIMQQHKSGRLKRENKPF